MKSLEQSFVIIYSQTFNEHGRKKNTIFQLNDGVETERIVWWNSSTNVEIDSFPSIVKRRIICKERRCKLKLLVYFPFEFITHSLIHSNT